MITIRRMQTSERRKVSSFVARAMREHYHCDAYELPESVWIAIRSDEVVGAMAVSMSRGEPLPLEKTYTLDYKKFPGKFERFRIVQLGRWVATVPEISEVLLYACVFSAIKQRCQWGIGEVKLGVLRRFTRMGIRVICLSGEPILKNIPSGVHPYYLLPPKPLPCVIFLSDAEKALREKWIDMVARGKILSSF